MVLNLDRIGVSQLSEMQEATARAFQTEQDIVLLSPTGSGKTLAYLLPLMQGIDPTSDDVQAIVVVPSRELAAQTDAVVKALKSPVRSMACYGGRPAMEEHRTLRTLRPHVVIATPGRLVDHLDKRNIEVARIRLLVIDEFDKSLELGFHDDMQQVVDMLPLLRRRVLLSATDAEQIPQFVRIRRAVRLDYLPTENNDVHSRQPERVTCHIVQSPQKDKLQTLYELLCTLGNVQTIVFVNYREAVERVFHHLKSAGVACEMYHGAMEQDRRERALFKFSNASSTVLVATDLASRGLDMPETDVVVHYHLPLNESAFIHRNGRTARWEATGRAFMILHEEESVPEYIATAKQFYIPGGRLPLPPQPLMGTIYIGKGKKHKLSKTDILGFLCKAGQLQRSQVGRIDVRDHCAYAAVHRHLLPTLLPRLEGQKIKGIATIFREAR